MFMEYKGSGITGPARIGRVTLSKSGKSVHYKGKTFQTLAGQGYKANYFDVETGEDYWISGCKKNGNDTLYPGIIELTTMQEKSTGFRSEICRTMST